MFSAGFDHLNALMVILDKSIQPHFMRVGRHGVRYQDLILRLFECRNITA